MATRVEALCRTSAMMAWGSKDCEILPVHREDFTPGLSEEAKAAFAGVPSVLKTCRLPSNSWFLAEDLTDFSQVLTVDIFYTVPGSSEGIGSTPEDGAYSVYTLDGAGKAQWSMGASSPHNCIQCLSGHAASMTKMCS